MPENAMTRKVGPLPAWGWVAIVGGGVVAWALWQRHSQAAATASTSSAAATPAPINQFQITTPPEQTNVTVDNDDDDKHRDHRRHRKTKKGMLVSGRLNPGGDAPEGTGNPEPIGKPGLPGGFGAPVVLGTAKKQKPKRATFLPVAGG